MQTAINEEKALGESNRVKLPNLEVPLFDVDIHNWRCFWEQFSIAVHNKTNLADTEKLVYLRQSLTDGSAKHIIEGLSRSSDCYVEAIKCLKARFDRPRLIHQTHVQSILEVPSSREGTGKELHRLHNVLLQHLRALKAMGHEPSVTFVTSLIELKLDVNTMFEWQRHSQKHPDIPEYQELLDFIDLRAQASETSHFERKPKNEVPRPNKKVHVFNKQFPSYTVTTSDKVSNPCSLCKTDKHPLYMCTKFRTLSPCQ